MKKAKKFFEGHTKDQIEKKWFFITFLALIQEVLQEWSEHWAVLWLEIVALRGKELIGYLAELSGGRSGQSGQSGQSERLRESHFLGYELMIFEKIKTNLGGRKNL